MRFSRRFMCSNGDGSPAIPRDTAGNRAWQLPLGGRAAGTVLGTVVAALGFVMTVAAANDEPGLKPEVATSLTRFGLTFVVGTYKEITDSGKSSVPAADAAVIGNEAK